MDPHKLLQNYFNDNSILDAVTNKCKTPINQLCNPEVGTIRINDNNNKWMNCSKILNDSKILVMKPTVKTSTPLINFNPYVCYCKDLDGPESVTCNSTSLSCIIKNYFIYLKSRNLMSYLENRTILKLNDLTENTKMTNEKQKIKISKDSNFEKLATISNNEIILVLKSPRAIKDLAKAADTICIKEFKNFISKHCFCNVEDTTSIEMADFVLAQCTKSKY